MDIYNRYVYICIYEYDIYNYEYIYIHSSISELIKMENIAPRAVIEPTSPAFLVSVLTITLPRLPDVLSLPTSSVYVAPCLRGQYSLLHVFITKKIFIFISL